MEDPDPKIRKHKIKSHWDAFVILFLERLESWVGHLATNRPFPNTATGGQGGISAGLAPTGAGKFRRLKVHVLIATRQVAEVS